MNILFVTEKWCDGSPGVGLTNNFHNLFNSFQQNNREHQFNTIHIDESYVVYRRPIDDVLLNYCENWKVDIIFFCLLGDSAINPSPETFLKLKNKGIKQCFIWPDTGQGWAINTIYSLEQVADLQVSWDMPTSNFHDKLPKISKYLSLWTPLDNKLYAWKPIENRPNDIAFFGRPFLERQKYLSYIQSKLPNFTFGGGQREQRLSPECYAESIGNSKIIINFPYHALGFSQLKGRVLESMASGSLVLELENKSTSLLFEAGHDYVSCSSIDDMIEKSKYYLNDEKELERVATNGYKKYFNNYTAKHYWDLIFKNL